MTIRTGDVHLTIVQGGAGKDVPVAPSSPSAEREGLPALHVSRIAKEYDVEGWEALAFVARLEGFAGREVDDFDLDAFLTHVANTRMHADCLQRMLAGAATVVPRDHMGNVSIVDPLDEDYTPEWAEAVKGNFERDRRARTA